MTEMERELLFAVRQLVQSVAARRSLDAAVTGMGHNILVECAARLSGDLRRAAALVARIDREIDAGVLE